MRILIKGGVWKNTEDEILKAAVMKYGLNQWARISSLLTRKSAKQCKARWYEWLDPSIKKTEWTREEDEKLLHLAKLMPQQWRTIAPIVGRTSQQCLERYDKLLDAAAARDDSYDAADDPRRLRPGEIDPNPEAKPARPDPIDMDEDEKEMLSEARARLANTKGKKAKRKAREKSLEEARRMASLQKKRELKAAGIELRQKSSKKKTINYNKEVAFEKRPAMGFYDTGEEADRTKEMREQFRPQTLEELEGRRRQDIEKGLMKADVDRAKLKDRHDRPQAVAQSLQQNETGMVRRRGKMMLPAPQVTEEELRQIQSGKGMDVDDVPDAENEAARLLRGDYETPQRFATPMRTPRTATVSGQDRIMQQARDASRLQQGQTPLLGGENAVQIERGDFGNSVAPPTVGHATPHPLLGATPGATPRAIAGVSSTPSVAGTPLRTPGRVGAGGPGVTPRVRDELGLNELDGMADGDARAEKARRKLQQSELRAGLSGLPQPQNEYQVMVPELPEDQDAADADAMEEDAADADARRKAVQKAREEAELRKRSQVLQRNLPRPATPIHPERGPTGREQLPKEAAELMIHAELVSLQEHDNIKYPLKASKKNSSSGVGRQPSSFEDFGEDVIGAAHELVTAEAAAVRGVMHHDDSSQQEYDDAWQTSVKDFIYLPAKQAYARGASATNTDRIEAARGELDWIRGEMSKEAKRAGKLEDKAGKLTKGLVNIAEGLYREQDELMKEVQELEQQVFCFKHLEVQEQRAAPKRLAAIDELVQRQKQREKDLQKRYKELQDQHHQLKLASA